jgi:flagellin-specific chaperone FliS
MLEQLVRANLSKDPAPMRIVEGLLREIRDAWALMLDQTTAVAA